MSKVVVDIMVIFLLKAVNASYKETSLTFVDEISIASIISCS
jgi:hypothetical protein